MSLKNTVFACWSGSRRRLGNATDSEQQTFYLQPVVQKSFYGLDDLVRAEFFMLLRLHDVGVLQHLPSATKLSTKLLRPRDQQTYVALGTISSDDVL